jgi:hypothetical protein
MGQKCVKRKIQPAMAAKSGAELQKAKNSPHSGNKMWGGIARNEESDPRWLQYVGRNCEKVMNPTHSTTPNVL